MNVGIGAEERKGMFLIKEMVRNRKQTWHKINYDGRVRLSVWT